MKRSLFIRPTLTAALLLAGILPLTAAPKGTERSEPSAATNGSSG